MINLDRFSQGLPDPQEYEPKLLGECVYCKTEIYEGDIYVTLDGDYYCDEYCLAKALGAEFHGD